MSKPRTALIRRGQLIEWLGEFGVPPAEVDGIIRDGVVTKRYTRPNGRAFYLVAEVEEKILAPMLAHN